MRLEIFEKSTIKIEGANWYRYLGEKTTCPLGRSGSGGKLPGTLEVGHVRESFFAGYTCSITSMTSFSY